MDRLRPDGRAAVFYNDRLPLRPVQDGQEGEQAAHLLHAVQAVGHVILLEIGVDIVHVRGGVDILAAPLLPGLRPLAGDEQHRRALAGQDGPADGLPPVGLDGVVAGDILGDLPADGHGVLLAGILLGENDEVGVGPGHLAQIFSPVQGLLAGAAEHGDDAPPGILRLDRAEQSLEAHAVVGIVHNGGDGVVGVGVDLHPPGHPGLHQPHIHRLLRDVQPLAHGDGGQGVFHIEQSGHGQAELPLEPAGAHPEQDVVAPLAHLAGVHVRLLILLGEGDDGAAPLLSGLEHPLGVVAVQIHAGDAGLGEDLQLGGEIVLKVRVLDGGDVVGADVQKAGSGKVGTQGAVILQRLAGHLHGHIAQAVVPGVGKVPLKLQGLRGGEVGLELLCAVIGVDGGDDARGGAALPRQILVQNILQVIGGGRLALGPGDANDVQITGGVAVVQVGQGGDGLPHVRHLDTGQVHLGIGLQADIGHGPLVPGHL